jgi:LPS export ABC transporter protein LptC
MVNTKSTLQADYAIVYQKTNTMEAHNNVIATNAQGQQLYTEELIWDKEKKLIYTEKDVKVVTDGKVLFGDGLTADESFDNWEITNPHGGFDIDENPEEENK